MPRRTSPPPSSPSRSTDREGTSDLRTRRPGKTAASGAGAVAVRSAVVATSAGAGAGGIHRPASSSSSLPLRDMAEDIARSVRAAVAGEVRGLKEEIDHLRRRLEADDSAAPASPDVPRCGGDGFGGGAGRDARSPAQDSFDDREVDADLASRIDSGGSGRAEAIDEVGGGIGRSDDEGDGDHDELDLSMAEFTFAAGAEFAFTMSDEDECKEGENSGEEHGEVECESVGGASEDDARKCHTLSAPSGMAALADETEHFPGDRADRSGGSRPIRNNGNRRPIKTKETKKEFPSAVRGDHNAERQGPSSEGSGRRRQIEFEVEETESHETESPKAVRDDHSAEHRVPIRNDYGGRRTVKTEQTKLGQSSNRGGRCKVLVTIVDGVRTRNAVPSDGDDTDDDGGGPKRSLPSPTRRPNRRRGEEARPSPQRRNRKRGPAPEWPCERCTYSNKGSRRTCEMCRSPKPKRAADDPEKDAAPPPSMTAPSSSAVASSSESTAGDDVGESPRKRGMGRRGQPSRAKKRSRDDPGDAAASASPPRSNSDRGDDNVAADEADEAEQEVLDVVPDDVKELFGDLCWVPERSAKDYRRVKAERGSEIFFGNSRKEDGSPRRPQCQIQPRTSPARKKFYGRGRCGECSECLKEDCGECTMCRDMVKFGGRAIRRQRCMRRQKCLLGRGGGTKGSAWAKAMPSPSMLSSSSQDAKDKEEEDKEEEDKEEEDKDAEDKEEEDKDAEDKDAEDKDEEDEWDDDDDQFEADLHLAIRMSKREQEERAAADDGGIAPTVGDNGGTGAGAPPPPPPRTVEGVSVGSRIEVYWSDDDEHYPCTVERFAPFLEPGEEGGWRAHLVYDDSVREAVDLRKEKFRLCKKGSRHGPRRADGGAPRKKGKKMGRRCGRCAECLKEDCLECRYCRNMTKYGGPGTLRQRCVLRGKCLGKDGPAAIATQGTEEAPTGQCHKGEIASKVAPIDMSPSSHERNREGTDEDDDSSGKQGPAGFVAQLATRDKPRFECGPKTLPGQETSEKAAYHKLEPVQPQLCFVQKTLTTYSTLTAGETREASAWWSAQRVTGGEKG